jgi:hypothetical protein
VLASFKQDEQTSTYIDAATAERQLVVAATSCASMEQVKASASGNKHAARTSASARPEGPDSIGMIQVALQSVELPLKLEPR